MTIPNDSLFNSYEDLTEDKLLLWEKLLIESSSINHTFDLCDSDILSIDMKEDSQLRTIRNDINRTRVSEGKTMNSFKDYCMRFLTFYCYDNNIAYKQGLNEIAGPLLLVKKKLQISFTTLYKIFVCFIDKYLTNYYWEPEFYSLLSSLSLVSMLLKYHDPEIYNYFESYMIKPEMYATSWVLTLFSNKLPLKIVYYLWNKLILWNDSLFLHFLMIALLVKNRQNILTADYTIIPLILSKLIIESEEDVHEIINIALDLHDKTPKSFRLFADNLEIFKYHSPRLRELYYAYDLENAIAIPIFPSELLSILYPQVIGCVNSSCCNFKIINNQINNQTRCFYCHSSRFDKTISYIILDLRIFSCNKKDKEKEKDKDKPTLALCGSLPNTIRITDEQLLSENFPDNIIEEYSKDKSKYHFLVMTSQTDYFKEYEEKFYRENLNEEEMNSINMGLMTKVNKELNLKLVKQNIAFDRSNRISLRIKEFDKFKKAMSAFLNKSFPYVSYIYGGFNTIHNICMKQKLEISNHDLVNCLLCKKLAKKTEKSILNTMKTSVFIVKDFFDTTLPSHVNAFTQKITASNNSIYRHNTSINNNSTNTISVPNDIMQRSKTDNHLTSSNTITNSNQPSKIEDNDKVLDVAAISELISNPGISQYTCICQNTTNQSKLDNIMVFLIRNTLKVYKEIITKETLTYQLQYRIGFELITTITKQNELGRLMVVFNKSPNEKQSLYLDFTSSFDSNEFHNKIMNSPSKRNLWNIWFD